MYMCVHQYMTYKAGFVYKCVFISTCHVKQPLYVYVFHQYMSYKAAFVYIYMCVFISTCHIKQPLYIYVCSSVHVI